MLPSYPKSVAIDAELILRIKEGDARSLELLFRRLYPRLCAYANKFVQDTGDSKEIVQDLFLAIWNNREHLDESRSLEAYLFTSVKNKCLNVLKARIVKSKQAELLWMLYSEESSMNDNSYHVLLANELQSDFNKALQKLPSECRRIFELSRFEGLRYQEIAGRLNISIKTVETQMYRALNKLRIELREHLAIVIFLILFK